MSDEQFRLNPYAASDAAMVNPADDVAVIPDGSGPPWEQPGPWIKRFFKTLWLTYRHPFSTFREMRRRGSWWVPIAYFLLVYCFSAGLGLLIELRHGYSGAVVREQVDELLSDLIDLPMYAGLSVIAQLLLILTGPAKSLLATFRSVMYAAAGVALIDRVPVIGEVVSLFVYLAIQTIAISQVHHANLSRSALVVVASLIVFCTLLIGVMLAGQYAGVIEEFL